MAKDHSMKVIELPFVKSTRTVKVQGAFTFLSAGDLIYRLEEAIEAIQKAKPYEQVTVSCHFSFLDVRCKKLLFNYFKQIENASLINPQQKLVIDWNYDWFDDDTMELGLMAQDCFRLEFQHIEHDSMQAV
jgi:hypothetical protein